MKFIIARIERNLYLWVDNWERKESKTFGCHIIHHNFIVFETCTFQVFPHSIDLVSFLNIELVYAEYFPNRKQDFWATCCSLKTTLTKKNIRLTKILLQNNVLRSNETLTQRRSLAHWVTVSACRWGCGGV